MGKTTRSIPARLGAIAVEALDGLAMFAAAGVGGWVVFYVPDTPTPEIAVSAGVFGLAFALGVHEALDSFMSSLRALTRTSPSPSAPSGGPHTQEQEEGLPTNAEELMDRLSEAARAGAAREAARYSGKVDPAGSLLDKPRLWVGVDGTSAVFPLVDGAYLLYRQVEGKNFPTHEYAFVTEAEDEPVRVTSLEQVRDLVQQHITCEQEEKPVAV
ncbi:hypothetical protein ACM01_15040 [Streptomyces viridochromogenes]|uniref:Uncharacterized protein n=1 Tax=Streptomyces viridochromogenes TaxID=1938 RepID=A0A0J8C8L1_STRVR|nr:hypothetical protein [Streptomyces viridochromogenes]KMS74230.1 hypothetical protein ACM01_15040 [Streptomyces viridochromogenes]